MDIYRIEPDVSPILPQPPKDSGSFPVDLVDALAYIWQALCKKYDVSDDLPDMQTLFCGADLTMPVCITETVIANMLLEIMEQFGRFSPWYKQPPETFGLVLVRDDTIKRTYWVLSMDAIQRWSAFLTPLTSVIERNLSVILATNVVGDCIQASKAPDLRVTARCLCTPPRIILLEMALLTCAEIVCDTCQQPFYPVDHRPGMGYLAD